MLENTHLDSVLSHIDALLADTQADVLFRALGAVGECSYDRWIPQYREYRGKLTRFNRADRKFDTRYSVEELKEKISLYENLIDETRSRMYSQPCMICTQCEARRKTWISAPLPHFVSA